MKIKILYRDKRIIETTIKTKYGTETLLYTGYYGNLIYDDNESIDEYTTKDISSIQSDLCNGIGFKGDILWARVPYNNQDGWYYKKIYANQFISWKSYLQLKEVNSSEIRMEQLIKELPVDQFIEYMKDNGLGMESVR